MSHDRLAAVRASTGGPFTAAQARGAGFSTTEIRRLLRHGVWTLLRRGVYVDTELLERVAAHPERRHALDVAALLLTLRYDAVGGGSSAAQVWGLDSLREYSSGLVVITDDEDVHTRHRRDVLVRRATLPAHHRHERFGARVTSAARTAVDLARDARFAEGVVLIDSALRKERTSLSQLYRVLDDCDGWPHIDRARRAVLFADPKAESALESVSRVAMHQEGVPAPRTQVVLGDERGILARVDFLWDGVKVIGEADGLAKYRPDDRCSTLDVVRAEKRREEMLIDAGYEIVRWGWREANDPPRLKRKLLAALARGAQRQQGRAG